MIACLTGKVDSVSGESCILDVQGVGYQVFMPLPALEQLSRSEAETVKIYTYYHLREDGVSLYGFLTPDDKNIFEKIIGVSGVGPKTALAIIGGLSSEGFKDAIIHEDQRALTSVSGVGAKTAQRLILELKGKIAKTYTGSLGMSSTANIQRSNMGDAVDALTALGYSTKEAAAAVEEVHQSNPSLTTPELVRQALRNLGRK
ncbi:MAG TPA: Holliday junction branch migration protein RuvA [Bacillota bacterium]|nr:Holliday junction branch migration protein RuvA [Bacillota bacterium]HPT87682.1 Holliday junction branch migration protein RuvA [Bacillota bacterium]